MTWSVREWSGGAVTGRWWWCCGRGLVPWRRGRGIVGGVSWTAISFPWSGDLPFCSASSFGGSALAVRQWSACGAPSWRKSPFAASRGRLGGAGNWASAVSVRFRVSRWFSAFLTCLFMSHHLFGSSNFFSWFIWPLRAKIRQKHPIYRSKSFVSLQDASPTVYSSSLSQISNPTTPNPSPYPPKTASPVPTSSPGLCRLLIGFLRSRPPLRLLTHRIRRVLPVHFWTWRGRRGRWWGRRCFGLRWTFNWLIGCWLSRFVLGTPSIALQWCTNSVWTGLVFSPGDRRLWTNWAENPPHFCSRGRVTRSSKKLYSNDFTIE